jgi:hypothetical protein
MQSPSDEPDDKSWLRVPLTDPVAVAESNDLWDQHNLAEVLNDLCTEGILIKATWSEPQPYMPGNADFADQILVLYATLTVA